MQVDNYEDVALGTARERLIGLTNRVIAGILIHTTRMSYDDCDGSRFSKIERNCASGISTTSYGVDPVFVRGSSLFDPDLDNVKSLLLHYNCSQLPESEQVCTSTLCLCYQVWYETNLLLSRRNIHV